MFFYFFLVFSCFIIYLLKFWSFYFLNKDFKLFDIIYDGYFWSFSRFIIFMYRRKIVAQDEDYVTIPKETFNEMVSTISHLEQGADDHEYLKYDYEKQREEIENLKKQIDQKDQEIIDLNEQFAASKFFQNKQRRFVRKFKTEKVKRIRMQRELEELKRKEDNNLENRILCKITEITILDDSGFEDKWMARFLALLGEINVEF